MKLTLAAKTQLVMGTKTSNSNIPSISPTSIPPYLQPTIYNLEEEEEEEETIMIIKPNSEEDRYDPIDDDDDAGAAAATATNPPAAATERASERRRAQPPPPPHAQGSLARNGQGWKSERPLKGHRTKAENEAERRNEVFGQ